MRSTRFLTTFLLLLCLFVQVPAQNGARAPVSEMRSSIERYTVDRGSLARSYPVAVSRARRGNSRDSGPGASVRGHSTEAGPIDPRRAGVRSLSAPCQH